MKTNDILKNVKETYSIIAKEFDATRAIPWPEFDDFLKEIKKHLINKKRPAALDVGCGNGRLYKFLKLKNKAQRHKDRGFRSTRYIGLDNNRDMLRIARKNFPQATFQYGDMLKLPFPNASFDAVLCIATLHHLPTNALREKALREMKRVLKSGGLLCIMVWNLWQPKYRKYINQKSHDAYIPWGKVAPTSCRDINCLADRLCRRYDAEASLLRLGLKDKKILRYYYAFHAAELRGLLKKIGFYKIKQIHTPYNFSFIAYEKS